MEALTPPSRLRQVSAHRGQGQSRWVSNSKPQFPSLHASSCPWKAGPGFSPITGNSAVSKEETHELLRCQLWAVMSLFQVFIVFHLGGSFIMRRYASAERWF
jgi:hypothetical protein